MLFNLTSYFGLDSSNECVKEDGIIIEESDDNGDQVGRIQVTEAAQIHSGAVVDKLITIIVAFLLKFRIVYNISNRAIIVLLRFFKYLLLVVGQSFGVPSLSSQIYLPQSIPGCYSYLQLNSAPYKVYAVCPSCQMLYDQAVQTLGLELHLNLLHAPS